MAGQFDGQDWISSTGYYVGRFAQDWIGLKATGTLSYLRYGEFHRIEDGQAVESYIYLDIPELMISCNQWPLTMGPGLSRGGPSQRAPLARSAVEQFHSGCPVYKIRLMH